MELIRKATQLNDGLVDTLSHGEGIPPLLFRLLLAPVLIQAGWNKLIGFDATVAWFGGSLGLPFPEFMTFLVVAAELVGGALLVIGLAVRWVSIPLMITMLVAIFTVHWPNGWLALADASSWLANEQVLEAAERKARAIAILREHGNYGWLTSRGPITILNNGIEFPATYFLMLLSLFFTGGGRFTSLDYWIRRIAHKDDFSQQTSPDLRTEGVAHVG
ncbi:MAG: HvfX family Cu-binding RiPP maturation protein [Pseudomonadales bacterium]